MVGVPAVAGLLQELPGPFEIPNPSIMLLLGVSLLLFGSGVLASTGLKHLGASDRTRIVFAVTLMVTTLGVTLERPLLRNSYYIISVVVVAALPLIVTIVSVRELVR
jgi:drug/metabolite transporter (DMT)-like permease